MLTTCQATARFLGAVPVDEEGRVGALLGFRPERSRLGVDRIEDFADLDPALTVAAVRGLGKVLRILRAARIATPAPHELVGQPERATGLLERARGTQLHLELVRRTTLRFVAWTETGIETIEDVDDVLEDADNLLVRRRRGHHPIVLARSRIVRHQTERNSWHEILDIRRT